MDCASAAYPDATAVLRASEAHQFTHYPQKWSLTVTIEGNRTIIQNELHRLVLSLAFFACPISALSSFLAWRQFDQFAQGSGISFIPQYTLF